MSILRQIFGPSKAEIWRQLSDRIGGDFVDGGLLTGSKVQVHHQHWTIALDICVEGKMTFTRMRAPYVNKDGFRFTIYRRGLFSGLGKLLGMQDIEIGDPQFDDAFIIKGDDEMKLRALLANPKIRQLIEQQPKVQFTVRDDDGWFGTMFPEGVDELYFLVPGVVKDVERLKALYDLFAEVLNHLCHIGSAYEDEPGVAQ
jgi:hypothetical protein